MKARINQEGRLVLVDDSHGLVLSRSIAKFERRDAYVRMWIWITGLWLLMPVLIFAYWWDVIVGRRESR